MDDKIKIRLNSIIEHINKTLSDIKNIDYSSFIESDLLIRATCFSVVQIGEQMSKLENILKDKYPEIPWKYAKSMRNFIVHDYDNIDTKMVYNTVKNDLPILLESFIKIKQIGIALWKKTLTWVGSNETMLLYSKNDLKI